MADTEKKTYRHKFSPEINTIIQDFSQVHLYDSKSILKEQYDGFWESNIDSFMREKNRLEMNGFQNDLKNAIFRSIKYYHIKKLKKSSENTEQQTEQKRNQETRDYIKLNKFIIQWIDTFIINSMKEKNFKPSKNYESILQNQEFMNLLQDEKPKIINKYKKFITQNNEDKTDNEIEDWWVFKIKKTHKNRYFSIMNNKKNT
ncbi:hypothetical protein CL656_04730 [bacterium]|nr:hypothetical protein [bacterium]|tara:strand:- start:608 stop:1213 length:606 start_codon:yes stop_codon:yes gene_type:complete